MLLLSRVYKRPHISGICAYHVPGTEAGSGGVASVKEAEKKTGLPVSSDQLQNNGDSALQEDNNCAGASFQSEKELRETSARQGYHEGMARGKAEAEAGARELLAKASWRLEEAEQEAASCLQQARLRAREIVSASETDIVELAVAIAEKLIQDQLEIAPQKVAHIVRESMNRHFPGQGEQLEVYLHPVDLPACRKSLEQFAEEGAAGTRIRLLPDERLSRGSCRIESESSTVEYLLNNELEKIRETLLQTASAKESGELREKELACASH